MKRRTTVWSTLLFAGLWLLVGVWSARAQEAEARQTAVTSADTLGLSFVEVNGLRMRIAQQGEGPLVVLLHGFPELWYTWRKQLPALAAAGYHAVAPDLRGYGGTDAPEAIDAYDVLDLCGDVTGLIDALGEETAVMVGHDWGAAVAWYCALLAPSRFRGLVTMSVPWGPRSSASPVQRLRQQAGENFHYMLYFQEPGVAEAELEGRTREFLCKLFAAPGTPRDPPRITDPRAEAGGFIDRLGTPKALPEWISQEALDYYVRTFQRTGFRGGLNYYRNLDRNWELTPHLADRKIEVPTLFMAGDREFLIQGRTPDELEARMQQVAPHVRVEILPGGIGHWLQEQAPEAVNALLIDFLWRLGSD